MAVCREGTERPALFSEEERERRGDVGLACDLPCGQWRLLLLWVSVSALMACGGVVMVSSVVSTTSSSRESPWWGGREGGVLVLGVLVQAEEELRGVKGRADEERGESGLAGLRPESSSSLGTGTVSAAWSVLGDVAVPPSVGGALDGDLGAGPWSLVLLFAGGACVVLTSLVGSFGVLLLSGSGSARGGPRFLLWLVSSLSPAALSSGLLAALAACAALLERRGRPLEDVIFAVFTGISQFLLCSNLVVVVVTSVSDGRVAGRAGGTW